jgi:hypothetical protein
MSAKRLLWGFAVVSLVLPAATGGASVDDQHHGNRTGGPLPGAVREATERFRDINQAIAAGYAQFQGCVSGPEEGAMGVHYVKFDLFDDRLEVDKPEALVYEPRRGALHLVAVEYITPAAAWQATHAPGVQPDLMGHLFHFAPGPNRYGPDAFFELHVWAWKENPRGVFADWNPSVSCAAWDGGNP